MEVTMAAIAELSRSVQMLLAVCALIYFLFWVRFAIHFFAIYRVRKLSDLPMQVPIPKDVYIGLGLPLFVACGAIVLDIFVRRPTVSTAVAALLIDLMIIFCAVAPMATSLYHYGKARRDMEAEAPKRGSNG